eukprot:TRINITY_DN11074_c0_g1_i1.p1 TRINITY_DN11074_c0_g1~~TRINITY_DN11074_c0_g1_i1.p1  ORF type:complete len:462 (+),score=70.06 TRINITY_DN11074_c0_g1_i1:68-1453(+)
MFIRDRYQRRVRGPSATAPMPPPVAFLEETTLEVVAASGVAWRRSPSYSDRITNVVGPTPHSRVRGNIIQGDVPYLKVANGRRSLLESSLSVVGHSVICRSWYLPTKSLDGQTLLAPPSAAPTAPEGPPRTFKVVNAMGVSWRRSPVFRDLIHELTGPSPGHTFNGKVVPGDVLYLAVTSDSVTRYLPIRAPSGQVLLAEVDTEQPVPPVPPPPPAGEWRESKDPRGHTYYWNSVTGEARWDNPNLDPSTLAAVTDMERRYAAAAHARRQRQQLGSQEAIAAVANAEAQWAAVAAEEEEARRRATEVKRREEQEAVAAVAAAEALWRQEEAAALAAVAAAERQRAEEARRAAVEQERARAVAAAREARDRQQAIDAVAAAKAQERQRQCEEDQAIARMLQDDLNRVEACSPRPSPTRGVLAPSCYQQRAPPVWHQARDPHGNVYYYNDRGETTWVKPSAVL